jgi:phage shock protein PspC (stress-responsive transcriptional regulator)
MESIATFIEKYPLLIKALIIVLGYFATFGITSYLIKKIVLSSKKKPENETGECYKNSEKK